MCLKLRKLSVKGQRNDSTIGSKYSLPEQPTDEAPVRLVRIHLHADVRRRRVCIMAMFSANKFSEQCRILLTSRA
jgi:hypothetical protein